MQAESHASALVGWAAARDLRGATFKRSEARFVRPEAPEICRTDFEALLLEHLDFIERTVGAIARRHALSSWEADDLAGQVKLRLISDDYAVFRKFRGKSQLTTYLTTVIQNLFRDFRIQRWGKWRPSAAAKRFGDVGVQLEALLYRDRFSFDEAAEHLRGRLGVEASDQELLDIASELRPRTNRRFESDRVLAFLQGPDVADQRVIDGERAEAMDRVRRVLADALASLDPEDRLILKLRFAEGLTIRAVAVTLDFDQRRIYSRVRTVLNEVRRRIVERGVRCGEVLELLEWPACAVDAGLADEVDVPARTSA